MSGLTRVLILSATYGEGHQRASLAVRDALLANNPAMDVQIVDYIQMVHPMLNSFARYFYLKSVRFVPALYGLFYKGTSKIAPSSLIQRRLNRLGYEELEAFLHVFRPDLVLSTFPTPAGVMSLLRERGLTAIPTATVITDHAVHSQWIHRYTDHYFVGSEHVKRGLMLRGVPATRVTVSGIPIGNAFLQPVDRPAVLKRLGMREGMPTLLVMGGAYGVLGDIVQICDELFQSEFDMQVIVVCGRNDKLRQSVEALRPAAKHPVWVFGFTREVHELMAVSDLILTKAGGLTVSEALAMEVPMLLYRPIPGQETQNAAFLVRSRVAVLAKTRKQVFAHVERLLGGSPARLSRMKENTRLIRRATAAQSIADELPKINKALPPHEMMIDERYYAQQS